MTPNIEQGCIVIEKLRENSRMSLTIMNKETQIPISTLHENIRFLRNNEVITCTATVDWEKLLKIKFKAKPKRGSTWEKVMEADNE